MEIGRPGDWAAVVLVAVTALAVPPPGDAGAVVIQDGLWRQEGGRKGHEAEGFGANLRLAAEPQFRPVLALSRDGAGWGEGSATWLGNAGGHAFLLTSAHIYTLPAKAGEYVVRSPAGGIVKPDRIWIQPGWNGSVNDRTGYDLVILRLPVPLDGMGEPPPRAGSISWSPWHAPCPDRATRAITLASGWGAKTAA